MIDILFNITQSANMYAALQGKKVKEVGCSSRTFEVFKGIVLDDSSILTGAMNMKEGLTEFYFDSVKFRRLDVVTGDQGWGVVFENKFNLPEDERQS